MIRIFTSKLLRCVQTAYEIAKILNISTLYLSKGLALTALAVWNTEKKQESFHFLSIEELKERYIVDDAMHLEDCDDIHHEYHIPTHDWLQAIGRVSQFRNTSITTTTAAVRREEEGKGEGEASPLPLPPFIVNIIIAHRETIRNFLDNPRIRLPYCCIAPMKVHKQTMMNIKKKVKTTEKEKNKVMIVEETPENSAIRGVHDRIDYYPIERNDLQIKALYDPYGRLMQSFAIRRR